MPPMKKAIFLLPSFSAAALAAANTNVVQLATDAKDTVDVVVPLALVVAGLLLAITIGIRAFKRISKG